MIQITKYYGTSVKTGLTVSGELIIEKGFKAMIYRFNEAKFIPLIGGSGWEFVHVKPNSVRKIRWYNK